MAQEAPDKSSVKWGASDPWALSYITESVGPACYGGYGCVPGAGQYPEVGWGSPDCYIAVYLCGSSGGGAGEDVGGAADGGRGSVAPVECGSTYSVVESTGYDSEVAVDIKYWNIGPEHSGAHGWCVGSEYGGWVVRQNNCSWTSGQDSADWYGTRDQSGAYVRPVYVVGDESGASGVEADDKYRIARYRHLFNAYRNPMRVEYFRPLSAKVIRLICRDHACKLNKSYVRRWIIC